MLARPVEHIVHAEKENKSCPTQLDSDWQSATMMCCSYGPQDVVIDPKQASAMFCKRRHEQNNVDSEVHHIGKGRMMLRWVAIGRNMLILCLEEGGDT